MYKTIIMPVDAFEIGLCEKAVQHAQYLAQQDGNIHLLHALPRNGCFDNSRFDIDIRRFEKLIEAEVDQRLQAMVEYFNIDPARIKTHVGFGSVRGAVNNLVEELKADLVVIGSRNPSITTHLLGSNASSIVRHTHIPVMVVR